LDRNAARNRTAILAGKFTDGCLEMAPNRDFAALDDGPD
jgi:hypothetical protein